MHGGSVYVKSEYGNGSEFIMKLPVTTVMTIDGEAVTKETAQGPRPQNIERIQIEFSDIYT